MCSEVLRDMRFEVLFEKDPVEEVGAFIVSLSLIPANHEIVPVSTVSNSGLVHDTEVVAILEDLLATLLRVYADNLCGVCRRSSEIILLDHTIAFDDASRGFGCIEWQ